MDTFANLHPDFKASKASHTLFQALEILKEINLIGKRKIPETAPMDFLKSKWFKHVIKENGIDRHYYEFGVFSELYNHLRSGDMWVVGSRQYKDFERTKTVSLIVVRFLSLQPIRNSSIPS